MQNVLTFCKGDMSAGQSVQNVLTFGKGDLSAGQSVQNVLTFGKGDMSAGQCVQYVLSLAKEKHRLTHPMAALTNFEAHFCRVVATTQ